MDVVLQLLQPHPEELEQVVLLAHAYCCVTEPVDRRKKHRLHRASARLVCSLPHEEVHERVQLRLVADEQQLLFQSVSEPVEAERLRAPRFLVLAWLAKQAQPLRACRCCLAQPLPDVPEKDRLVCERLREEVHVVEEPEREVVERLPLRPGARLL